jgi:hypothetical protein
MDTTKTYIAMSNCEEIQGNAPEFYRVELTGTPPFSEPVTLVHQEFFAPVTEKHFDRMVWLPRQDQIQEMLGATLPTELLSRLLNWFKPPELFAGIKPPDILQFTSMEQLWLSFYMWECHSKVWDGDKWTLRKQ